MAADYGIPGKPTEHPRIVLALLLLAVSINLFYPGEVFFQSHFLFVLVALLACTLVLYQEHQRGISVGTLRHLALAFLPLASMIPSVIWTTNQIRSQEVLLLFFSYSCLLFSLWRSEFRASVLLAAWSTLVAVTMVIEGQALYQHFVGLDALKAELMQQTTINADFKSALLARAQSGRVFGNFSLPNTLAGLVTMILPLQVALLWVALVRPGRLEPGPVWIQILMNRWFQGILSVGIVLSLWVLALTQSFGGWVSLCCSLGVALGVWLRQRRRWSEWVIGVGLLLMLAGVWMTWTSHKRGFRLWDLNAVENPITLRLIGYRTALDMFRDFPYSGVGLGNFGTLNPRYQTSPRLVTRFAHNTPLQLLAEGGLVLSAGLMIVGAIAIRWKRGRSQPRCPGLAGDAIFLGMVGSLVAWFVHNNLDIDLYFPSLGGLGFFILGLFLNHLGPKSVESYRMPSRIAKAPLVLIELALILAIVTAVRFQVSRSLLDLSSVSASSNDLVRASGYARWAVKIRPRDGDAIVFWGKLETKRLQQEGRSRVELLEALSRRLGEAVRLDPYNAELHYELSRVYQGLGLEELSDESLAKAVALFPSEPRYRKLK